MNPFAPFPTSKSITGAGVLVVVLLAMGCHGPAVQTSDRAPLSENPAQAGRAAFTDVTAEAGIRHRHRKPILDQKLDNIMSWVSSVGAAAAAGDFDNDGWIDLYVTNSRKGLPNYLYRNNGDGTFKEVAEQAGLAQVNGDKGASMDCVWGDVNNDGWVDLYLVRWGTDSLFINNGDGTFKEVTSDRFKKRDGSPGVDWANGCGAIFLDYDFDGRLDIYVANYFAEVDLWHLQNTSIMHDDFEKARNAGENFLYHQNSDGSFTEVAVPLGLNDRGWTLAVGAADLNNDGWPDLYCADDFGPDQLFINNRDGTFTNRTETAIGFDTKKGMNVDFGDVDGDGWFDIYVANITTSEYLQEGNMLWHNNGPDETGAVSFTDISLETGTYDGGWGWGAKFFDFDNDADLDIIAVNGFISAGEGNYWYDLASWTVKGDDPADSRNWPPIGDRSFSGYEKYRLWRNDGPYLFSERAADLGVASDRDGRGAVCFDYDNDGDLDLFVANQDQAPHLYRNDASSGHWLTVRLQTPPGSTINRDAIGARVTIVTDQGRQMRERDGGNGYCGQSDPRLCFGLGSEERVTLLEVRWPDGGSQYLENVAAGQHLTLLQDPASYATEMALSQTEARAWVKTNAEPQRVVPAIEPAALDALLSEMEAGLRRSLDGFKLASTYRARAVDYGQHDRSIEFFEKLVADNPESLRARIELACAYVDKIPTCGGMAAIVSKGTLARKSLDQLDAAIAGNQELWIANYTRGINHLNWPRALRHSDAAAADLLRCVELQRKDPQTRPYYVRTYIALGDAQTKAKNYAKARRAWRDGLKLFPKSDELKARLEISDEKTLLKYVEEQRSLQSAIDTDLSFLDRQ